MKQYALSKMALGLIIGFLLLGCSALSLAGGATSVPVRGGELLAFTSDRDGNSEIYVMDKDGGDETRRTENPASDSSPAWSPDGGRLVFKSDRDGNPEIYVMDVDGSSVIRLTNNPAVDASPVFSPDGTRIAFESSRDDSDPVGCWPYNCIVGIYVMDANGGKVIRLSDKSVRDSKPAWSPDGTQIVFHSSRDDPSPIGCQPECNYEIYIMDADGGNVAPLTKNPARDIQPTWSPDGKRIAFASNRSGNWDLYVMDADGSNVTRLTDEAADDEQPVWSSDGSEIAFMSRRDGDWEIFVMSADGGAPTQLTKNTAGDWDAVWQP